MDDAPQQVFHHEFAPASWFGDRGKSSVWISAFRVLNVGTESALATQPALMDFVQAKVRAHFYYGTLRHMDFAATRIRAVTDERGTTTYRADLSLVREVDEPLGGYLVLLTPFAVDGEPGDEHEARLRLAPILGLLAVFEGRTVAFEQVFEHAYEYDTKQTVGFTEVPNPSAYRTPDLSVGRLEFLGRAETQIERLPDAARTRVRRALQWEWAALCDVDEVNSLLKHWIALETLLMPDDTDIEPLVIALARAHDVSVAVAKERFSLGRIYGLRSRIVHGGWAGRLGTALLDHIADVFTDCLATVLDLPSERRAAQRDVAARDALSTILD